MTSQLKEEYKQLTPLFLLRLQRGVFHSWWVVLTLLLCYFSYEHALKVHTKEYSKLHDQYKVMQQEKEDLLKLQAELNLQINSQSDPAWMELILMAGLGVVPEGQIKVFFTPTSP